MSTLPSSSNVYLGAWVNWSKGSVLGSTITTTATAGAVIVAFLAVYITLCGTNLWTLLCFLIYHRRSSKENREGFFHQQQTLLRNNNSPFSASMQLFILGWFWRKSSPQALRGSLAPVAFGVTYAAAILIASICSSYIVASSSIEVLVQSPICGFWPTIKRTEPDADPSLGTSIAQNQQWTKTLSASSIYSRACYNTTGESPQCQIYSSPKVEWESDYNASCPFAGDTCFGSPTSALKLDTGFLNVARVFGVNVPSENNILFRKVSTCAPIESDRFVTVSKATVGSTLPGETLVCWYFGPGPSGFNFTWAVHAYSINRTEGYTLT